MKKTPGKKDALYQTKSYESNGNGGFYLLYDLMYKQSDLKGIQYT